MSLFPKNKIFHRPVRKTLIVIFVLATSLFGVYFSTPAQKVFASGSWLSGWSYRKEITISHVNVGSAPLSNFPLLVKIAADSDMSAALSSGYDIRFTTSDGTTLLSYERESWSGGGGSAAAGIFWVKVPTISNASDTAIYAYYGNSSAVDGQNATDVWDPNYDGVWHLGFSLTADSTSNANNGTNNGAATTTDGQIYGGGDFSPGTISVSNNVSTTDFTISTWFKVNGASGFGTFIAKESGPLNRNFWLGESGGAGGYGSPGAVDLLYSSGGTGDAGKAYTSSTYDDNTWHLAESTYDGTNIRIYIDGALSTTVAAPTPDTPNASTTFGVDTPDMDRYLGELNEIHVSSIPRPANWINFEYCNEMSTTSSHCSVPTGGYASNEITFASQAIPPSTSDSITSFSFGLTGETDTIGSGTVSITVPYGTNLTNLTPTIAVSAGATILPASGSAENFTNPVTYTVTAQDGVTTTTYTVTLTVGSAANHFRREYHHVWRRRFRLRSFY